MSDVTVRTAQELHLALGAEVAKLSDKQVMDRIGFTAKHLIEDRTVKRNVNAEGEGFPRYDRKPIYVSLRERPAPRGGIKTPQGKRKVTNYNKRTSGQHSTARNTTRGGKSMYFPGGYEEYKANLYGPKRNLTKSGVMFDNLMYRANDKEVTLYFAGDAANERAAANEERTPFFAVGIIPEEAQALREAWEAAVGKRNS